MLVSQIEQRLHSVILQILQEQKNRYLCKILTYKGPKKSSFSLYKLFIQDLLELVFSARIPYVSLKILKTALNGANVCKIKVRNTFPLVSH